MPSNEELLDHAYQPPDGDILHRYRFLPPGAGPNNQYPTVLMLPPDVFYLQYEDHGVPSERWATQTEPLHIDSPVSLVTSTLPSSPPVMLYTTLADPVPYEQAQDMFTALFGRFGMTLDLHLHIMTYTGVQGVHAFTYWHELDTDPPNNCVSHEVIAFLQSHP
jgi:hypothetical protein